MAKRCVSGTCLHDYLIDHVITDLPNKKGALVKGDDNKYHVVSLSCVKGMKREYPVYYGQ